MNSKKRERDFRYYLDISFSDIIVYLLALILLFFVLLYIAYVKNFYYILLLDLFVFLSFIEKIFINFSLKKIETYLKKNNLIDRLGLVYYWNDDNCFFTENYVIYYKKKVYIFKYSEIKSMHKEAYFQSSKRGGYEEYLIINTLDNTFSVLTHSTNITCIDYNDLSKFILDKNPNIIVEDEVKNGTFPFTLFR